MFIDSASVLVPPIDFASAPFLKNLSPYIAILNKYDEAREKYLVFGQFADSYELSIERINHVVSGEIAETTR